MAMSNNPEWGQKFRDYQTFAPKLRELGYSQDDRGFSDPTLGYAPWSKEGKQYGINELAETHGFNLEHQNYRNIGDQTEIQAIPNTRYNPNAQTQAEAYGLSDLSPEKTITKQRGAIQGSPWKPGDYQGGHLLLSDPRSAALDAPYLSYDPATGNIHVQGGRMHPTADRLIEKGDENYDKYIQRYNNMYNQANPTGPGADWQGGVWTGHQSDTPLGLKPVASMKPPEDWAGGVLVEGYEGSGQLQPYSPRPTPPNPVPSPVETSGIASLAPSTTESTSTDPFTRSGYTGAMTNPYMNMGNFAPRNPYLPLNFGSFASNPIQYGYPGMGRNSGIAAFMLGY